MPDTTLHRDDLSLTIDSTTGLINLRIGPALLTGRCQAEAAAAGFRRLRLHGERITAVEQGPVSGPLGAGEGLSVQFAPGPAGLRLVLEAALYDGQPFLALRVGLHNDGPASVRIETLTPLSTTDLAFGSGPLDGWVNGFHAWSFTGFVPHSERQPGPATGLLTAPQAVNPTSRRPHRRGCYAAEWVGALIDGGKQALAAGFIGLENQFGQVYLDGRPDHRGLTLQNTADGVPLDPGQALWGEWAVLYHVALPRPDPLGAYAEAAAALTPPRLPASPPTPGWSSWYQFFDAVTADDMARNRDALAARRSRLPLDLFQLDDGYQPAWGDWLQHNARFPEGVAAWAADARAAGFEPGLWLSPFTVDPGSDIFREAPKAVLRGPRGRPAHGGFLLKRWIKGLDPTHPAAQDHVRRAVETIVHEWGIHYLKLDFLYCGALPGLRHNPSRTRAQALRDGLRLIRETAGPDVTILGCGCPFGPAVGLVDVMRVSADVAPHWYPQLFGIGRPFRRDYNLPAARSSSAVSIHRAWTQRRWWWLDADNLLVREDQDLTAAEVQTLTTVIGMLDSHLIVSDDLPQMAEERLRWAASLLPILPGEVTIPALFSEMHPPLIVKRYDGPAGPHTALALINWSDRPVRVNTTRAEAGLPAGEPLLAFDFWNREARIIEGDRVESGLLPPHGCALLALRPLEAGPQLAGSDLHISMGAEISAWNVAEDGLSLSVTLGRTAEGALWLRLPAPPTSATCDGAPVDLSAGGPPGVYRLPLTIEGEASLTIRLSGPAQQGAP